MIVGEKKNSISINVKIYRRTVQYISDFRSKLAEYERSRTVIVVKEYHKKKSYSEIKKKKKIIYRYTDSVILYLRGPMTANY